jgi:hypothetical protein
MEGHIYGSVGGTSNNIIERRKKSIFTYLSMHDLFFSGISQERHIFSSISRMQCYSSHEFVWSCVVIRNPL